MRNPLRRPAATELTTSGNLSRVPDQATLRSRRRFARRQWRRRWLAWRYVVGLVAVIVVLVVAIWLVYFSGALSVKGVDIHLDAPDTGAEVGVPQVAAAAAVPTGKPLATADLAAVQRRVTTLLPAVLSATVSREWPDKIRIDVVERTPVAVLQSSDGLHALDATGQVFLSYPTAPPGLPLVSSASTTDTDALAQGAQVAAALPKALAAHVDHLQILTQDNIQLDLRGGGTVLWGSADDSGLKVKVLAALRKAQPHATTYDVSVPGSPAVK